MNKNFVLVGQKAIILNNENKMLLLLRSNKSGAGGKWSLAGGALEKNEDPVSGLQREINEETRLEVSSVKPFFLFPATNEEGEGIVMIGYHCKTKSNEVTLNWEHIDYKWVTKAEALQMELTQHAELFINKFVQMTS